MASVWEELKRRNVVRVAIAYSIVAWLLIEVSATTFPMLNLPDWAATLITVLLLIGFPVALIFAWAFEMTPEGLKKERDVDRSKSIIHATGRKFDFAIIGVLAIAVGFLLFDKIYLGEVDKAADEIIATEHQSIAVLPFVNMSDDEDYFADGLSEELMNLLARIPDLKVTGRTSSFQFKGRTDDLREIGDALGVNHVLEGSVRRSGDRLRVTAQLIKVDDGFHIWSETYNRTMADIFDIQDDVASSITRELELRLVPDTGRSTDNANAYALYVEALPYIASNDDPNVLDIVIGLLDRALELDPGFAKAHEAKANTYSLLAGERVDFGEAIRRSMVSATSAIELDESLILARYYVALGEVTSWYEGYLALEVAVSADPDNFNLVRIKCADLMNAGYFREALVCTDHMISVEPLSPVSHWRAGIAYGALGQRQDAHKSFSLGAAGGSSSFAWELVFESANAGDFATAAEYAVAAPDEYGWQPDDIQEVQQWAEAGDDAAIIEWIEQKTSDAPDFYQRNRMYAWYLALGRFDEFWAAVERILSDSGEAWGNTGYLLEHGFAYRDRGMLRHPGFLNYAKTNGLFDFWERRGAPDFCAKESGEWVCK